MLYYTGDGPRGDEKAGAAFGYEKPVPVDFVRKWAAVAREYGERYGEKVAGWWVDGCYPFIGYNEEKLGILAEGLKAGYPERIIALNPGVEKRVGAYSRYEDYTCGEQNKFLEVPVQRFIDGEQWHVLSYLGNWWGEAGTRYTKQELAEYVHKVTRRGGVVSVDVLLFRDGTLDRSQLETLKAIRPYLETAKHRGPVPPGNRAFDKPAQLLSLDGTHELEVNRGVHVPAHGVDGDPKTAAQAAGEWPWTYEVDLLDTVDVRRVRITFGANYATQFEVEVSADHAHWMTVAKKTGHDGAPWETEFEPVPARWVRVRGIKPDGPGQEGGQMSIAEVEVYE